VHRASIYVHFPWCLQKCPYCDFASRPSARGDVPHEAYADAVIGELEARREETRGRALVSVFFGGGTPSLWDARALGRVLDAARRAFAKEEDALEITVECNPSSLDREKAQALAAVGVNRLSVGVQSLDDARLRFLGRLHDGRSALTALEHALSAVPRVSGDLIFGQPGQSTEEVERELETLTKLGLRHVSAYALTIEAETPFGARARRGTLPLAKDDDVADAFLATRSALAARGLEHYEVSNYAVPGEESRHNLHTWRGGDYIGLGAGAVGCVSDAATRAAARWRNTPDPAEYIAAASARDLDAMCAERETLSPAARVREALMLGLRTREGLDLRALRERTGVDPRDDRAEALERRIASGDLALEGDVLRVPPERWLWLDGLVAELF
jgi:oxygen-independent coproporphyrinogen-3 oxidase